mmetsp:Transcript_191/g.330  ORF Transcript_191/g.330 Transcript_191/m.330 type:complete len:225 (+) Transcript_191:272-946(+)
MVLRLSISKRTSSEKHLKVDDSNGPDVNFVANSHIPIHHEAFRWQIPICSSPLTRQFHAIALLRRIINNFAQPKVGNFGIPPLVEQDIARLQVVVNDALTSSIRRRSAQVPHPRQHLKQHRARVPLRQPPPILQKRVQIRALATLQNGRKAVRVDLEHVVQAHDAGMAHLAVYFVLAGDVFGVVFLLGVGPGGFELVDFDGNVAHVLEVEGAPDLGEAALAEEV